MRRIVTPGKGDDFHLVALAQQVSDEFAVIEVTARDNF
jgi:hypothetical protein